ncbi:hypothetical protein HZH66_003057 [Vespula vulgaris]|uniref:Uncharacterized protein n=1 Tax=Vespula vulgaris TaxID=7454 RepID=A0A834KKX5_VESVU|nr:hypothetical protein HZH66_003057 [Vespula vulgaris]
MSELETSSPEDVEEAYIFPQPAKVKDNKKSFVRFAFVPETWVRISASKNSPPPAGFANKQHYLSSNSKKEEQEDDNEDDESYSRPSRIPDEFSARKLNYISELKAPRQLKWKVCLVGAKCW